jgi:molecular chaperone GrpE
LSTEKDTVGGTAEHPANPQENPNRDNGDEQPIDRDMAALESALGEAEREAAEQREAMLRLHAEMENLRKRLQRDLERSRKRALESIMNDLLPVRDSLEKGLQAAEEDASVESLREGKALIMRMLGKVLEDHGLEEIDPVGETFNPELHEAMSMIPSPQHAENEVIDVIQKGYRLHDRLIRPARVVVSSGG